MCFRKSFNLLRKVILYCLYDYSCDINYYFRNNYTIDYLLRIIEEYSEEFKILGAGALTHLCRDTQILNIFK
jgi:hypothetical protein